MLACALDGDLDVECDVLSAVWKARPLCRCELDRVGYKARTDGPAGTS